MRTEEVLLAMQYWRSSEQGPIDLPSRPPRIEMDPPDELAVPLLGGVARVGLRALRGAPALPRLRDVGLGGKMGSPSRRALLASGLCASFAFRFAKVERTHSRSTWHFRCSCCTWSASRSRSAGGIPTAALYSPTRRVTLKRSASRWTSAASMLSILDRYSANCSSC